MFDRLSDKLDAVFKKLKGRGKLNEAQVGEALREVRLALLEADVNYKVTKAFIERIRERAVGEEVMRSLTPAQQVIKIVHEELTALLGGESPRLDLSGKPPVALMLVGLQGSGKTTTAGQAGEAPQGAGEAAVSGARGRAAARGHRAAQAPGGRHRGGGAPQRGDAKTRWPLPGPPWKRPMPRALTR